MTEDIEAVWMEKRTKLSIAGLAKISGLTEAEVCTLVEYGALAPTNPDEPEWTFEQQCVVAVRTAGRLQRAFELEPDTLALTFSLVERIRGLQEELRRLRVMMPHRSS
ncbi:MAG: chaperone modulator CbpM [Casimicrobiaceae bacterium]